MTHAADTNVVYDIVDLAVEALTPAAFAPFGTVIIPEEDGTPFGPEDARLDFSAGTPRFYAMRVPARGLLVKQITRHRQTTQVLASVGGHTWFIAVAPPHAPDDTNAEPDIAAIRAFRIPGDTAIMLGKGTWHAGPLFEGAEQSFFNLELADTNIVDHQTSHLSARGCALRLVEG